MTLVSQHLISPARLFVIRYRVGASAVLNSPCGLLSPLSTSSSRAGDIELEMSAVVLVDLMLHTYQRDSGSGN